MSRAKIFPNQNVQERFANDRATYAVYHCK